MNVKEIILITVFILILGISGVCASDNSTESSLGVVLNDSSVGEIPDDFGRWVVDENGNLVKVPSNCTFDIPEWNESGENFTDLRNNASSDENMTSDNSTPMSSPASMNSLWKEFVKDPEAFLKKYNADPVIVSVNADDSDYNNSCSRPHSKEFDDFLKFVAENSVKPCSIESRDVNVFYSKSNVYRVRILNAVGQSVGKGVSVVFTFNGHKYSFKTDDDGYASFKFSSSPGSYNVRVSSGEVTSKKRIVVKALFKTKDITKKYGKSSKFTVRLIKHDSKSVSKKTVKITFKGKTHNVKTNSKGIATFTIPKNLKIGKYNIKTSYNGCTVKNRITVKR